MRGLDEGTQHLSEFAKMKKSYIEEIIKQSGVKVSVAPGQGLAMKTELGIRWNKMRRIRKLGNIMYLFPMLYPMVSKGGSRIILKWVPMEKLVCELE